MFSRQEIEVLNLDIDYHVRLVGTDKELEYIREIVATEQKIENLKNRKRMIKIRYDEFLSSEYKKYVRSKANSEKVPFYKNTEDFKLVCKSFEDEVRELYGQIVTLNERAIKLRGELARYQSAVLLERDTAENTGIEKLDKPSENEGM